MATLREAKEAIAREQFVRDAAFLELPDRICSVEVPPLTLDHILKLSATNNPFLVGGQAGPLSAAAFFILLCDPKSRWARWRLLQRISRLSFNYAHRQISEFVAEAFQDSPGGGKPTGPNYYSFAAGIISAVAHHHGWSEREILHIPVKRLFQYLKAMQRTNNPEASLFNPSDKVRGDWLREVNTSNKRN